MDPIQQAANGSQQANAGNAGGAEQSMMALLMDGGDDSGAEAAPTVPVQQQNQQQHQQQAAIAAAMAQQQQLQPPLHALLGSMAPQQQAAPQAGAGAAGGFGDLISEFRMDRGANGLAPPAMGASVATNHEEILSAQQRLWGGAAGAGAGATNSGGSQKQRKKGDDEDDDDWQPGKKQSKKPRTGPGAATGVRGSGTPDPLAGMFGQGGAAPPNVGPGMTPFAGQTMLPDATGMGAAQGWDGQSLNQWAAAASNPLMAGMQGLPGYSRGQMLPGMGAYSTYSNYGMDPATQQQLYQQQMMMQQQMMGGNPLGSRLFQYGGMAPAALGGPFGGAFAGGRGALPIGMGAGVGGMWTRGRLQQQFMPMQEAPPPEPESHEADELLSKCEQVGRWGSVERSAWGFGGCKGAWGLQEGFVWLVGDGFLRFDLHGAWDRVACHLGGKSSYQVVSR